jgi:hypothetical protein
MDEFRQHFIETVKEGAMANFAKDKEVRPVLLSVLVKPDGEKTLVCMSLTPFMNPDGKDLMARFIQTARTSSPAVAMVTESWMVKKKCKPGEKLDEEIENSLPPSEDPEKIEVVSIMCYFGLEAMMIWAEIIRPENGDPILANWQDPGATALKGRFAKPPPDWS